LALVRDQDVCALDVSVSYVHLLVQVEQALQQLLHHALYLGQSKFDLLINQSRHIIRHVIEKKVVVASVLVFGTR